MNKNNMYTVKADYMEQLEDAEIKIKQNEIKLKSVPRLIGHIVLAFFLCGFNLPFYFLTNYKLKKEIEVEKTRIDIIKQKINREDMDRQAEREYFGNNRK